MANNKKIMLVKSLEDLNYLLNHNCGALERQIKKVGKNCRSAKVLCMVAIGYAFYAAVKSRKLDEQIYQLSIKVKKLECNEGE